MGLPVRLLEVDHYAHKVMHREGHSLSDRYSEHSFSPVSSRYECTWNGHDDVSDKGRHNLTNIEARDETHGQTKYTALAYEINELGLAQARACVTASRIFLSSSRISSSRGIILASPGSAWFCM
jgi:hypothetical protein